MRVKQTAKKISSEIGLNEEGDESEIVEEKSDHNSDNEVEFVVECRRDLQGNQFLLDGTPVIEPAAVEVSMENSENINTDNEVNFEDFVKEIQDLKPSTVAAKKSISNFNSNLATFNSVKCTACNIRFNPYLGQILYIHPLLEVILCKDCIQNQKEEFFVVDKEDNKETLCRWCVEGGSLICCDICPKSYCKTCIKRNLGRTILSDILNQDEAVQWKCFVCDPKPIESLKAECKKICNDVRLFTDKHKFQKIVKKPMSRLYELVQKKRPLSKAFPNETTSSLNSSNPKLVSSSQPLSKKGSNSGVLLTNMANFGTEWYMRNVKLHNIFSEIDDIDSRTLLNALNSTKKCVEAFYSDIRNLEVEISKASTVSDINAIVDMFKSVYRHHIFNRFCQVKARIDDDKKVKFLPQTANGIVDYSQCGIKNANDISSLSINNAVSIPKSMISHFTSKVNLTTSSPLVNGNHKTNFMASIDLTDDADNISDSLHSPSVVEDHGTLQKDGHVEPGTVEDKSKEVVDLCVDDDSTSLPYPIVNLNINNQLSLNGNSYS